MFKRIASLILATLVLTGCPSTKAPETKIATTEPIIFEQPKTLEDYETPEIVGVIREKVTFVNRAEPAVTIPIKKDIVQIAILLPLTGNGTKIGQSMKKAFMLSFANTDTKKIKYEFFDTQSTPEGSVNALRKAEQYSIDVILGPVYAQDVRAIKDLTTTPIISFSTDTSVISSNTFSMGLLQEEEVRNLKNFMINDGVKKTVVMIPNNQMGRIFGKEIDNTMNVSKIIYYTQGNLTSIDQQVRTLSEYDSRKKELDKIKSEIKNSQAITAAEKERRLKKYENIDTIGETDFDSIIIIGNINDTKGIVSYLRYYEVDPRKVKYYGTSVWSNNKILTDGNFLNANYVSLSQKSKAAFEQLYQSKFDSTPEALSLYAYDAGKLVQHLSRDGYFNKSELIAEGGYNGINGTFRILSNGKAQYLMDLYQINGRGTSRIKQKGKDNFK